MEMSSTLLAAVFLFSGVSLAANCSTPPIYVDIHQRTVHGTAELEYGSYVGVGTPAQNQSLWPSLRQNETSFAHEDFCAHSNFLNCSMRTGGFVDPSQSAT